MSEKILLFQVITPTLHSRALHGRRASRGRVREGVKKGLQMQYPEIVVYNHPNPEIKSFITTIEISAPRVEHFKKPLEKDSEDTLRQLGVIGAQAVREIMSTPGVKEIHIKPNEIRMKKEISSSWDDIEKQVIKILYRALRKKQIKVIKG